MITKTSQEFLIANSEDVDEYKALGLINTSEEWTVFKRAKI